MCHNEQKSSFLAVIGVQPDILIIAKGHHAEESNKLIIKRKPDGLYDTLSPLRGASDVAPE